MPKIGLKILNIIVFIVLCTLGVLFLLASPVDPVRMQSRIIVGSILIVLSLVSLITISLLISRNEYGNVRYVKKSDKIQEEIFYSKEVVCPECGELIKITDNIKANGRFVYCDQCGKEIQIPKDNVNWG